MKIIADTNIVLISKQLWYKKAEQIFLLSLNDRIDICVSTNEVGKKIFI